MNSPLSTPKKVFIRNLSQHVSRLLSSQDRNPASNTYGCFDMSFWRWRQKDFPNASLQYSVFPLALLWGNQLEGNPFYQNKNLREWILAGISFWISIQHENGAFDQSFPFEQGFGTTAYTLHGVINAFTLLRNSCNEEERCKIEWAIKKAAFFLLENDETYGVVSNHMALFACSLLEASRVLNDDRLRAKAFHFIDIIKKNQSSEGWFLEYEGADPGYQTQCLFYLVCFFRLTQAENVLEMARKGLENFSVFFFHPDGTVGGLYGSRNTEIYYPGAFEMLRNTNPTANRLAFFMRSSVKEGKTVGLESMDLENFSRVFSNYLIAYLHSDNEETVSAIKLPWESPEPLCKDFPEAGLFVRSNDVYYAILNVRKGGVAKVFHKKTGNLHYEDFSYFAKTKSGDWISSQIYQPSLVKLNPGEINFTADFFLLPRIALTPFRFLFSRLLSLTLFRNIRLGNLFKYVLVKLFFTGKRKFPVKLLRRFIWGEEYIEVFDEIKVSSRVSLSWVKEGIPFWAVQMASAGYFQPTELARSSENATLDISRLSQNGRLYRRRRISF